MNLYTFAPDPVAVQQSGYANWVYRLNSGTAIQTSGWYYKQSQWKKPAQRALVMDSVNVTTAVDANWPWWTGAVMPALPDSLKFSIDFNRHGKRATGNSENDFSINMLFCDSHADSVTARQAHYAVRFALGSAP
jgi:hypothetical protein